MNERKKRNIIIGSLCTVLLLMVVGYAAFSTALNINGTSSISSNWDIKITKIETQNIIGEASNAEEPTGVDTLTATFKTNLVSPGDSISYKITVSNLGNLDAKLEKINVTDSNNPAIKFETSGLTEGDTLTANGGTATLKLKITYDSNVTSQPENTKGTISVTLDYVQADGNGTVTPSDPTAADKLIETAVTTGDGLYQDEYEDGRYIYKGTNPNNYIRFNDETWRILSVENDGTLKIMKKDSIGNIEWDATGTRSSSTSTYCTDASDYSCNAWSKMEGTWTNGSKTGTVIQDASLNTYLNNDYYNSLSSEARNLIQTHIWSVGPVTYGNSDLAAQIASENGTTWSGNIGLMSASEFLRANNNTTQCGNPSLNNANRDICKTTNYIVPTSGYIWTISPRENNAYFVFNMSSYGSLFTNSANCTDFGVLPALYLKSNINLEGEGTETNPYTIVS